MKALLTIYASAAVLAVSSSASAQVVCQPAPHYTYRTVYEQRPVTTYRLEYETVFDERDVTTQRPVWTTEMRERRYTVAKPYLETSEREERYTVLKPVWETHERDESYDRVVYYTETSEREERYTVRRPVTSTVMQDQQVVQYQGVTTMRTDYVDQGGWTEQWMLQPGQTRNRLRWMSRGYYADPLTGQPVHRWAGLYWVPQTTPGRYYTQRQYVPNVVARQTPQTTYRQVVLTHKVPVEVTRWEEQVVTRKVPVKVQRSRIERVTRKVPVQTCRWVEQEMVRKIPVTTYRTQYEERVEKTPVRVCRWVTETRKVQTPRTIARWRAYTTMQSRPRTVLMRVDYNGTVIPSSSNSYPAAGASAGSPARVNVARPPANEAAPSGEKDHAKETAKGADSSEKAPADEADPKNTEADADAKLNSADGGGEAEKPPTPPADNDKQA